MFKIPEKQDSVSSAGVTVRSVVASRIFTALLVCVCVCVCVCGGLGGHSSLRVYPDYTAAILGYFDTELLFFSLKEQDVRDVFPLLTME